MARAIGLALLAGIAAVALALYGLHMGRTDSATTTAKSAVTEGSAGAPRPERAAKPHDAGHPPVCVQEGEELNDSPTDESPSGQTPWDENEWEDFPDRFTPERREQLRQIGAWPEKAPKSKEDRIAQARATVLDRAGDSEEHWPEGIKDFVKRQGLSMEEVLTPEFLDEVRRYRNEALTKQEQLARAVFAGGDPARLLPELQALVGKFGLTPQTLSALRDGLSKLPFDGSTEAAATTPPTSPARWITETYALLTKSPAGLDFVFRDAKESSDPARRAAAFEVLQGASLSNEGRVQLWEIMSYAALSDAHPGVRAKATDTLASQYAWLTQKILDAERDLARAKQIEERGEHFKGQVDPAQRALESIIELRGDFEPLRAHLFRTISSQGLPSASVVFLANLADPQERLIVFKAVERGNDDLWQSETLRRVCAQCSDAHPQLIALSRSPKDSLRKATLQALADLDRRGIVDARRRIEEMTVDPSPAIREWATGYLQPQRD